MNKILRSAVRLAVIAGIVATGMIAAVQLRYLGEIEPSVDAASPAPVAIVLGASVKQNGDPSPALQDRIETGVHLYNAGRVEKILITGDDGLYHIDEIHSMRRTLENFGVPEKDILEDGHGYRTFESCQRAKDVFGVTRAIVVTQRFHLPRALYLCNRLGIVATGVAADLRRYDSIILFTVRDLAASLLAWVDINIRTPSPPVSY